MGRRYSVEWIVLWLLVGAVLALATEVAKADTAINCYANGCDNLNYSPPAVGSCSEGTQVIYQLSVGGQRKIWEWHSGAWSLVQNDCPTCWTGDSINWYSTHGYAPVTISVYDSSGLRETIGFTITSSGSSGTLGNGTVMTSARPAGCTAGPCTNGVTVAAHWDGGAPEAAGVVVNLVVGGILAQISCDRNGCNSGTIPAAQLNVIGNPPWSVDTYADSNNWAICGPPGNRYRTTPTVIAAPSTIDCGGSVNVAVRSNCSASPTPSPSPSASIAPSPSTTPVLSPSPFPTPINYTTPPPNNPGTGVTNGGTTMTGSGSGITNQDIYNDVKQALDDAGNRDSTYTTPDGGFGYGNDPGGENGSAGNGLESAVDRFTNDLSGSGDGLMGQVDAIDSLSLPTSIGDKSSWAVSLPVLGDLTIDLSTFDGPVWAFRSLCLGVLVVGAWFAIVKIVRSGVA